MAKKKQTAAEAADVDDLAGTVEGLARDHFEREKAAYEERTGLKVEYVPGVPTTRTPILEDSDQEPADDDSDASQASDAVDGEAQDNQSEGDI